MPSSVAARRQGKDMYMAHPGLRQARPTETAATAPAGQLLQPVDCFTAAVKMQ